MKLDSSIAKSDKKVVADRIPLEKDPSGIALGNGTFGGTDASGSIHVAYQPLEPHTRETHLPQ